MQHHRGTIMERRKTTRIRPISKFYPIFSFCFLMFLIFTYGKKAEPLLFEKAKSIDDCILLFDVPSDQILPQTERYIEALKKEVQVLCNVRKFSYITVANRLDQIQTISDAAIWQSVCNVLALLSPDEPTREKARKAIQLITDAFLEQVNTNKKVYSVWKQYYHEFYPQEVLSEERRYFVEFTNQMFQYAGLSLIDTDFSHFLQLKKDIAQLSLDFEAAITKDKSYILAKKEELTGLNDSFIKALPQDNDYYELHLDYPTYMYTMQYCTNKNIREKLYYTFHNRAYPENKDNLHALIKKRQELAKLLRFENYAAFDLSDQMANSTQKVHVFLNDLLSQSADKVTEEFKKLKTIEHPSIEWVNEKLMPWDLDFLRNLYKKQFFNIDEEEIAEYFPLENTIKGLFEIYTEFLGVSFKNIDSKNNFWHQDVRIIQVFDANQSLLGTILLDLFPRPDKYTHAAELTVVPVFFDKYNLKHKGLSVVFANFPPASEHKPALLKRGDVKTFFHEFGHALHAILGITRVITLSGTATKTDFVEVPSQLLEEWLSDKDILRRISSHYLTKKPLNEETLEKIVNSQQFLRGYFIQRQVFLSKFALACHEITHLTSFYNLVESLHHECISHVYFAPDTHIYASFGHLTGYASKYYGYLWALVFAEDLFAYIKEHGLTNNAIGKRYVDLILKPGGTQDPYIMLERFLNRKPSMEAFFNKLKSTS